MTVVKANGIIVLFLLRSAICIPYSEFYKRHGRTNTKEIYHVIFMAQRNGILQ